jgi:hypothetical protein
VDGEGAVAPVEEDQIELEAHTEGMDAGAARDQQPGLGLGRRQAGEAEQAAAEIAGDRDQAPADAAPWERAEASGRHCPPSSGAAYLSPAAPKLDGLPVL